MELKLNDKEKDQILILKLQIQLTKIKELNTLIFYLKNFKESRDY